MIFRRYELTPFTIACVFLLSTGSVGAADSGTPPLMIGSQRLADLEIPVEAVRGSGIAGALNPAATGSSRLSIVLPDGRALVASRQRVVENAGRGQRSWIGTFVEMPGSIVVLSKARGVTTGFITYGADTFEIMPTRGGRYMIYEVDQTWFPDEDPVLVPDELAEYEANSGSSGTGGTATGVGLVHDLLVVYTPASSARYGQGALESKVVSAVAAANQAYLNSGVNITLNLVGLQEIDYAEETGLSVSLSYLNGTSDGKMDSVHALRDLLGADMVSLVSEDIGCGIAFLMAPESSAFARNAFSAVYSGCLSQHSLAHEIGHNQGNMHDRDSSSVGGAFPYSHGFRRCVSDGTGFRTVMGYNCVGAPRVTQFSNPNVLFNGWPTGVSYEADPANSADNARSMNETADTVAAFRGGTYAAPPLAPSSLSAAALAADSVRLAWADNSTDEAGFSLDRSGNGVEFTEIAMLGADTTTFTDTGLTARTAYWYRLRAFNGAGYSDFSGTASVTTPDVAPEPPVEVAASDNGDGSASVSWVDASNNETGFEALRETWDARRGLWKNLTTVATVPAGITSFVDITGTGTFRYSIRTLGLGTTSGFAGPAQVSVTGGTKGLGKGRKQ